MAITRRMFKALCAITISLSLSGCAHLPIATNPHVAPVTQSAKLDPTLRIAVATAYEPELGALRPALSGAQEYKVNGVTFYTGTLSGQPVVLFMTGVSLVNASMNTQLLLDHFNIAEVIMSGIAGGVDPSLSIGDVTVPAQWAQYNESIFMRETAPGKFTPVPGYEPELPSYQFIGPQKVRIASAKDPNPAGRFWFFADEALLDTARAASRTVKFSRCTPAGQCLAHDPKVVVGGAGVSGSIYQDNASVREYLFKTFKAQVVEMESAAVAMVAYANGVPYISFRSLSDLAGGGNAPHNEMEAFEDLAAINAAAFVQEYLKTHPALKAP